MNLESIHFNQTKFQFHWSQISLTGEDAFSFLQGQSTNDISSLGKNEFQLNCLIDIKGKIESYFLFINSDNPTLLLPNFLLTPTIERLNKFIIMEDVFMDSSDCEFSLTNNSVNPNGSIFNQEYSLNFEKVNNEEEMFFQYLALFGFFKDCVGKSINETLLVESSVSFSKGCFLGQEIVSKIHNNRGASYFPVMLEGGSLEKQDIIFDSKKRGEIIDKFQFDDKSFMLANLFRDYRVEGRRLNINEKQFIVHIFPYMPLTRSEKAQYLFDKAVHIFTSTDEEDKAIDLLLQSIRIDPTFADSYESLGVIYGRHEQYDKAIDLMNKLVEIDEKSIMAHTNLSLYYMKQGRIEEAEEEKSKATVKTFEKFGDEAQSKREGDIRKKKQQEELVRRENMFAQVLDLDVDDTLANYGMGEIALEREDYSLAVKYLEKVIEQDAKYSVAYLALGKSYFAMKNLKQAQTIFEKGISVAAAKGDLMPANSMQALLNSIND